MWGINFSKNTPMHNRRAKREKAKPIKRLEVWIDLPDDHPLAKFLRGEKP